MTRPPSLAPWFCPRCQIDLYRNPAAALLAVTYDASGGYFRLTYVCDCETAEVAVLPLVVLAALPPAVIVDQLARFEAQAPPDSPAHLPLLAARRL